MSWFFEFAEPNKEAALTRLDAEAQRSQAPENVVAFVRTAIEGCQDRAIYVKSTGHLGKAAGEYDSVYNNQTTEVRNLLMPRVAAQWAFTPAEPLYPPYVNISELDDGTFEITVRAPRTDDDRCGASATMPISAFELKRLVRELAEDLL